jgi:hypothetical protein
MIDVEPLDAIDAYIGRRISDIREASALLEEGRARLLELDVQGLRAPAVEPPPKISGVNNSA